MSNQHPRNTVRWRPGTQGFYKPRLGASKMKWHFEGLPYVREVDSLHHYPEVSRVTGKQVDWYHGMPEDGYEAARIYGENTLELKGMPMGKTPEYIQERLRRFFSKFGPVQNCRAEPHKLDPYQCEGTAFITFRDKSAALKALKAPLKFPATLHDKVISMRHLDTDKTNDPNYFEKSKFWNAQLISIARQLHTQLLGDSHLRALGKPLTHVGDGIREDELVELGAPEHDDPAGAVAAAERAPWGRGGVPLSKGLHGAPTRMVAAEDSVLQRFKSWEAGAEEAEPPLDELFQLERRKPADSASASSSSSSSDNAGRENASSQSGAGTVVVVRPRLVSSTQRARILTRVRMVLAQRLHDELSVWWRAGKVPLPEYTQRRVTLWDHKPKLPFDVQIQSRSKDRHRIFDERFLYRSQIVRARNDMRKERRSEYKEERKKELDAKQQDKTDRRDRAMEAVSGAHCSGLLGNLAPLLPKSLGGRPSVIR
eukprot:CAMPEP_0115069352 /NCGR_PEP_ID=MMETSP0227-20121206/12510_1 /TAXON_ID=89957 /ORGANISM="Polarella glacialis, Strain CCMP 1383" /LENGTH=482 /DNA_ID=CAMNT_0002455745 /DNA_START=104 /DNA_END=1552 /DNA_ORIENTATION=+